MPTGKSETTIEEITNDMAKIAVSPPDEEIKEKKEKEEPQPPAIKDLKDLHAEHEKIEAKYLKDLYELESKYRIQYAPLYEKRAKLLSCGTSDENTGTPAVPKFWLTVMKNSKLLSRMIYPNDERVLKYLMDISCEYLDQKGENSTFKLIFTFLADNPFFTPNKLEKTFKFHESGEITGVEGTKILWKEGKNVTKLTKLRKQQNPKTKQTRTISETIENPSFFDFFETRVCPSDTDDLEDIEIEDLGEIISDEYEAGLFIRDKIIPHAVAWYLGEEVEDSSSENYSDEDDGDESEKEKATHTDDDVAEAPSSKQTSGGDCANQ